MKYWKVAYQTIVRYYEYNTIEALKENVSLTDEAKTVITELTKPQYDLAKEKERLVKLIKDGVFNTSLTTYFNSVYRRANNLPDSFYTNLTIDGKARSKKQILNSISGLAVDSKYIIAYDGSSDFIALEDNQIDTYLKDIFTIEENYRTNKNPEWLRLVKLLEIQQAIEEKFSAPDSSILKLIHQLMYINLQGTEHTTHVPDTNSIDWGALVSGGTN